MLKVPTPQRPPPIAVLICIKACDSTFHKNSISLPLSSDHDEQHLEPGNCFDCMMAICRQDDALALLHLETVSSNLDVRLAIGHHYQCIERRGVFTQAL